MSLRAVATNSFAPSPAPTSCFLSPTLLPKKLQRWIPGRGLHQAGVHCRSSRFVASIHHHRLAVFNPSLSTLPLSSLLHLKEATGRASVPAGGAGGLSRLRWPPGRREVAETVGLWPAGGGVGSSVGPSVSRVSFPVSKSRRRRRHHGIMSSRVLPRLDGAPLRRR